MRIDLGYKQPTMNRINRIKGIALLVLGLMLIGAGLNSAPTGGDVLRFLAGPGTDRSLWLVPGGIGSTLVGILTILRYPGRF